MFRVTHRRANRMHRSRGVAIAEFALILPFLFILVLPTMDLGLLTQARLIVSNVVREGGSIASRQVALDPAIPGLLQASARPLNLAADGKIYVTRIMAGKSAATPAPTITAQLVAGNLGVGSKHTSNSPNLGLSATLYNHLVFKAANSAADIPIVTVVEVYYKYRPITPFQFLTEDGDGTIVGSKSIF